MLGVVTGPVMNKNILLAVFAVTLLLGCTSVSRDSDLKPEPPVGGVDPVYEQSRGFFLSTCDGLEGARLDECLVNFVDRYPLPDVCSRISGNSSRDFCHFITGGQTGNLTICEKLRNPEQRRLCKVVARNQTDKCDGDHCWINMAKKTGDIEHCGKTTNLTSLCYFDVAFKTNNLSMCTQYRLGEEYEYSCIDALATLRGNATLCEMIDVGYRDICLFHVAARNREPALCETVNSTYYKDACYYLTATSMNKAGLCDMLSTVSYREECIAKVTVKKP